MPAPASTDVVLSLRDIAISVDARPLLRDVELALSAGELVALCGPSGTGKTMLLRAIVGLDDPSAGDATLEGLSADDWGQPQWRRRVLYVAQRPVMLPGTVRDNLALPFEYAVAGQVFPELRARELTARLLLGEQTFDQAAVDLSEGERQRVAIARALLVEPSVMLLDEPTSALDPAATEAVEQIIREMAERGLAALVVTHSREQAERWCDRVVDLAQWVPRG